MSSITNVILNSFQDLMHQEKRCRTKFGMTTGEGFTLIELMVVISVTAILGTLGIAGFVSFNNTQILQIAASDLVTTLDLARSRAASQVKLGSSCTDNLTLEGYSVNISFAEKSYALKSHCSGGAVSVVEEKFLPSEVEFVEVTTSASIFFPVITGGAQGGGGQIELEGFGKKKIIVVNPLGGISIQVPTPTP